MVAYEDADNHPEGRNVLFMDYHVERIPEGRFRRVMQRSLQAIKDSSWDGLSEERREELRRFHSPGGR